MSATCFVARPGHEQCRHRHQLAPVVDVRSADDEVIGDRSYSTNPSVVITYAGAFADGLRAAGVIPTLKHFPGHGRALGDSHQVLAVAPPLSELEAVDLKPYSALLERDTVVMTGHLDCPASPNPVSGFDEFRDI